METTQKTEKTIPEGYLENAQGHLVPIEHIDDIDRARDELVRELIARAYTQQLALQEFKEQAFDDVRAFVEMSAEEYDVQVGGDKGNVTLTSFDGRLKINLQVSNRIAFDERIQAAKKLVEECLSEWGEGARSEIRVIAGHAFKPTRQGDLNIREVLKLTKYRFDDERWKKAVAAIQDSMTVAGSKEYMRFYERDDKGQFRAISLDLASI